MTNNPVRLVAREASADSSAGKDFAFEDGTTTPTSALTYAPASVVTIGNAKFVYISGHTGTTDSTEMPQSDKVIAVTVGAQTSATLAKIEAVLATMGGTLEDVVRVRVYVRAELTRRVFEAIHAARRAHFHGERMPASTLVRVAALARPNALIEIDADAVIVNA